MIFAFILLVLPFHTSSITGQSNHPDEDTTSDFTEPPNNGNSVGQSGYLISHQDDADLLYPGKGRPKPTMPSKGSGKRKPFPTETNRADAVAPEPDCCTKENAMCNDDEKAKCDTGVKQAEAYGLDVYKGFKTPCDTKPPVADNFKNACGSLETIKFALELFGVVFPELKFYHTKEQSDDSSVGQSGYHHVHEDEAELLYPWKGWKGRARPTLPTKGNGKLKPIPTESNREEVTKAPKCCPGRCDPTSADGKTCAKLAEDSRKVGLAAYNAFNKACKSGLTKDYTTACDTLPSVRKELAIFNVNAPEM